MQIPEESSALDSDESGAEPAVFALPGIRDVDNLAPLRWLGRGFHDLLAMPAASLFYGAVLASMGYLLVHYYGGAIGIAFTTGFLIVGPFLTIGLYDLSRRREAGEAPTLGPTLTAWRGNFPAISFYAIILMLSLAVWMRVSVVVIALFFPDGIESLGDLLAALGGSVDAWVFVVIYLVVGAVLALFAFSTSAVALPMLLDRPEMDAISAMIVSFNTIRTHPLPLMSWAAIIATLTAAGFISWSIGLVFVLPMIGHGTWHAYRDCIEEAVTEPR
jgi:uncharacterized membrane protein